jgi:protein arginine N-methyltransferase 5
MNLLLQLPPPAMLARWDGEPVKALLVPTRCFVLNKRGYPVLPKAHQDFISHMLSLQAQVCHHVCYHNNVMWGLLPSL